MIPGQLKMGEHQAICGGLVATMHVRLVPVQMMPF